MPEIKSIKIEFDGSAKVSPSVLRSLKEKVYDLIAWLDYVGVRDITFGWDVKMDDEAKK